MQTLRLLCLSATLIFLICISVLAQTTSFSYQGRLTDMGSPANGNYVLQFRLFDALSSGTQVGATIADVSVTATNGSFTTSLDFGAAVFDGPNRFLEISVKRLPADPYTTLTPRQQILSTPYSIKSKTADNSTQLGGLDSTRYVQQDVTGNVSVSGTLTVTGAASYNTVNAQTQYNLSGSRILGNSGTKNLFIGNGTGSINSGGFNTFVGQLAGNLNTTGANNAFVGAEAGVLNDGGSNNAYFGTLAGTMNTVGNDNSFFGSEAGRNNKSSNNSFFGRSAGVSNTIGNQNSFFGSAAGLNNTIGQANSVFGADAGKMNTSGASNAFFGASAGNGNQTGVSNAFFGTLTGFANNGSNNAFFGHRAGFANQTGFNNAFFGPNVGQTNTTGNNNTLMGADTNVSTNNLTFASAIGAGAVVTSSNTLVLGRNLDTVQIPGNLTFSGTLSGNGSNLTNLNASNITSGTLSNSRLGLIPTANIADAAVTAQKIASGQVVKSLNSLSDSVTLAPGSNITITPSGNTLTIAATSLGGGSGILNQTTLQTSANFNIDGTGRANVFNANTHFSLGGNRILSGTSESGTANLFAGFSAGVSTTGGFNAFVGTFAGQNNTTGVNNSYFGVNAGGGEGSTGSDNTLVGNGAGFADSDGNRLTYIGVNTSNAPGFMLTNATAIGANARVTQNNSLVLGSINGVNGGTADTNVGIGTTAPKAKLHVQGGNMYVGAPGQGLILKSPDGATCRLLSIDNAGATVLTPLTCP